MLTDYLRDENDDLIIANGDFVKGDSIDQEVDLVLRTNKGNVKQFPLLGPNLIEKINGTANEKIIKAITLALIYDNKKVNNVILEKGSFKIDAQHK